MFGIVLGVFAESSGGSGGRTSGIVSAGSPGSGCGVLAFETLASLIIVCGRGIIVVVVVMVVVLDLLTLSFDLFHEFKIFFGSCFVSKSTISGGGIVFAQSSTTRSRFVGVMMMVVR